MCNATLHFNRLQCQGQNVLLKHLSKAVIRTSTACHRRYSLKLKPGSQVQSNSTRIASRTSCVSVNLVISLHKRRNIFYTCTPLAVMCDYLTFRGDQQFAESTLGHWPIFLLFEQCTLQYKDVLSDKESGIKYNFQPIHDAATKIVRPSAECYHTRLLQKLLLSYCSYHDLYKNVFQRDQLPVHDDNMN